MATEHVRLRQHAVTLRDGDLLLRPMTEADWDLVLRVNNDPEVGYFTEGDDWHEYTREEVQRIYRTISQNALMFVIEVDGRSIGECWLQRMNLERLLNRFPSLDLRRVDLAIADRANRGAGLGTRAIRLLVHLGFEQAQADAIFACDVWEYNQPSRRAFEKAGFQVFGVVEQPSGSKGCCTYDLAIFREVGSGSPSS
jgi:RimJ/RimL family protein N-acetyltransferase